jgi:HSP20 family protein
MLPTLRTNSAFSPLAENAFRRFDTLFDRFFGHDFEPTTQNWGWGFVPIALWQDDNSIHVEADLPGVSEKDVDVTVQNGVLTIKAERRANEPRNYAVDGRAYGRLERSVVLPDSVDAEQVEAKLENGVLSLTLPKHPAARPKKITVKTS